MLHLEKNKFGVEKIMYMPTSFIWIIIFFDEDFKRGEGTKFCGYVRTNT
jgi:hypothetical protein